MGLGSQSNQQALADYRQQQGFGDGRKELLRERLRASVRDGEAERFAALLDSDAIEGDEVAEQQGGRVRAKLAIGVVAAALLLGVVGVAWMSWGEGAQRGEGGASEAAYPTGLLPRHEASDATQSAEIGESEPRRGPEAVVAPPPEVEVKVDEPEAAPKPKAKKKRRTSSKKPSSSAEAETKPTSSAVSLAAELELIRGARSLAAKGDLQRALGRLDRHARKFPQGQLEQEREAYRVELLCRVDADRGKQARRRFVSKFPSSNHRSRLERMACEGK